MALPCHAGEPLDLRLGIDARAVFSDATPSFLYHGFGRTRFDDEHEGLRAGQVYASARYRLSDTLTLHGDAFAYGDGVSEAADIEQFYLQYRPFPVGPIRFNARAGAFYPEMSMEHRGPGWTTVYTLTPSAINTWFGEELRALGIETEARWLGASAGYNGDVALIAGVYGWNDPLGTLLTARGWALHDRQTGLFGYVPSPDPTNSKVDEIRELDNRAGYYVGAQWRHGDRFELRAWRYDNRGDPAAFDHVYAWLTRFDAVGARIEAGEHWTFVSQFLTGETYVGPQQTWGLEWQMDSWFVLASHERGAWRWSARYEEFGLDQTRGGGAPSATDDGHAITLSALWTLRHGWSAALEWLRVTSDFPARQSIALNPVQSEEVLQLGIRYQYHR